LELTQYMKVGKVYIMKEFFWGDVIIITTSKEHLDIFNHINYLLMIEGIINC
jgi:hypothetical protein